jgi:prephenate dehydrogenase
MAGSEHAGVEYAREDLLVGAPCIVTKDAKTNRAAFKKVANFWSMLGADVKIMSPASHDRSVSLISHLPHIVAFGLAGAVPEKELQYAAEGFKDTTRVASSDPELWADIFLTNADQVLKSGRLFEKYYKNILNAVSRRDYAGIVSALKKAKAKRDKFAYGKERP